MAALYLREYARAGAVVSAVRTLISHLPACRASVRRLRPGFFCYAVRLRRPCCSREPAEPTFGKPGLIWAAFTLALLTVPVVIVATEEALSAVPSSMREGSYACGASKWQTIRRIVLPRALPGIMTGMILAMARGAGEVAPLMLVGAVKLAPELPLDGVFPYVHAQRSFMHLGFHIYDLGFQSQNSEAAKPMVFTTTLLLIGVVFLLNVLAVRLRTRLRRRFESEKF
jgi:phosphate transport system permease protein